MRLGIDCPYINQCSSYSSRCSSCANNKNVKKDYYQPLPTPYIPWYPWYPWYPSYPIWTCESTGSNTTMKTDHYESNQSR
jgi:hypothetical protein